MMQNKEPVLELNLTEILTIFPRLKALEDKLSEPERDILSKMEGLLYEYLSIDELETLLKRI
ncbi:hypothetical protein [Gracilinema caldarium]|jgi:hypothetical protein|uniref:Uncharacterized protein n=1 Tax=Gracilinema caldarium TaxID=215591 RepID=A0A7C3I7C4_9SPIR|nr:hypothetical protein [Gracilinema caldarium]